MKILVLTPDLSQSGGVANYYNALKLNKLKGIEYFFVNKGNTASTLTKIYYSIAIYIKFIYKIRERQLIHINPSLNLKSFYRDMVFILLSRIFKKKVIIFFRGWEECFQEKIERNKFLTFLFRHTYAKATAFIVLSELFKHKLIALGVDSKKTFFIETTVAGPEQLDFNIEKKITSASNHINCLFLSRILKEKGIYIAIDAFIKSKEELSGRSMTFYIAGEGDELNAAQSYVKDKGVSDIIKFVGQVSGQTKTNLLEKSHIMIFPTYYGEGLPNCILEGMLYGMPIVSRINAGIPDVVEHKVNGYLTKSTDKDIFANFLTAIIKEKSVYESMALENYNKAQTTFTTQKVTNRLLNIYKQC